MQIREIRPEMTGISIKARVLLKESPHAVRSKRGAALRVCEVILGDISGRIPLTLWQKTIYLINVNQIVELKDAYATAYQGITKLTLGRNGTIKVIEEDSSIPSIHDLLKDVRENSQP